MSAGDSMTFDGILEALREQDWSPRRQGEEIRSMCPVAGCEAWMNVQRTDDDTAEPLCDSGCEPAKIIGALRAGPVPAAFSTSGSQRFLAVSFSNLSRIPPALVYRIGGATVHGDEGESIDTANLTLVGESAADSHDLLRGNDPEDRTL